MIRNKKGDASDIVTFLVIVFFLAVSFLVVIFANNEIKGAIENTVLNETNTSSTYTGALETITTSTVQNSFVFILAILVIGMMVSAFMVRVHPIFLFLYIFILGVSVFIAVPLANTYETLMNSAAFSSIALQQTRMNWIMEHLLHILIGSGALSMIVLFAKFRSPNAGGQSDF